jgi:hypothetical protein
MDNRKTIMLFNAGVLALAALLLWAWATTPAQANPASETALLPLAGRYVALPPTGNDAGNNCANPTSPCATIQHAIDVATPDDVIHVAGGIYTRTGTVAVITKGLTIVGAFDPAFNGSNPEMYHTVLDANWGGTVISITNAGDVLLQHLIVAHGDGTGNCGGLGCGGGVYVENTSVHVNGCEIIDNVGSRTGGGLGGGIYASSSAFEMRSSRVVSNTASTDPVASGGGWGGGIYVNTGSASLVENEFLDNVGRTSWTGAGGGIYLYNVTSADVLTNVIRGNSASLDVWGSYGGGLYVSNSSAVTVAGNRIEGNQTSAHPTQGAGYGGGVYVMDSDAHLARNTIIGNSTGTWAAALRPGGGVYIAYAPTTPVTLSNNLIVRNIASAYAGGGVYVGYDYPDGASQALLVNNTIADNGSSGIVAWNYAAVTLTNNLIAGHEAGLYSLNPASGTISADTNLFWNTTDPITGVNGILQNPLLTPDYRPCVGSPAIDAGLAIPWLTTDLEGNSRPQGSGYDIGAFEGEGVWWRVFLPLVIRNG